VGPVHRAADRVQVSTLINHCYTVCALFIGLLIVYR
jgi:hypothetical protein